MRIQISMIFGVIALLLTLFTWLGGGIVAPWLSPWTPWATLLLAELMLVLPEQQSKESIFDARRRVWHNVVRDPLLWVSIVLILFLVIQWLNASTFLAWDEVSRRWTLCSPVVTSWADERALPYLAENLPRALIPRSPDAYFLSFPGSQPVSWLPWSLRADEAWGVLNWFPPILAALLAVRHALRKRSKRHLCIFICGMTSVLAIAGIVQYLLGGEFLCWGMKNETFFFATFGYPNHAACYFPAVMALAIGMVVWSVEHREHARMPIWLFGLCAVLCAISGILSGSRAGMLFTLGIVGLTAIYLPFRYVGSLPGRWRIVMPVTVLLVALGVIGTAAFRIHAVVAKQERAEALTAASTALNDAVNEQMRVAKLEALAMMESAVVRAETSVADGTLTHLAHEVAVSEAADAAKATVAVYQRAKAYGEMQLLEDAETTLRKYAQAFQRAITGAAHRVTQQDASKVFGRVRFVLQRLDESNARAEVETARALADARRAEVEAEFRTLSALPSLVTIPALDRVLTEIAETDWAAFIEHPMLMRSGYQGILAMRQLDAYPLFGAGAHSFRWLNYDYIDPNNPEEKSWYSMRLGIGQANVHNDTLQYLAEHGWVGFGLMCGCILALFLPFMKGFIQSPSFVVSDELADRCWVNRLNGYFLFALMATTLIAAHSFIDLVFRSPSCMMLYGLLFVCAPGFLLGRPKTRPTSAS